MTTTDSIYLIKETSICNYVMIIHSPHLCGLPGFRADHSDVEMAKVRCREVISDDDFERWVGGEEVVMPFLTIGKGIDVIEGQTGTDGQSDGLGERRVEGNDELHKKADDWIDGNIELQMEDGVTITNLKDALAQLLSESAGGGEGEEGELMLITLEEDGDEPIVLQADLIGGEGNERGEGGVDKETVLKFVKEYLRKKDKSKRNEDDDREEKRDEL